MNRYWGGVVVSLLSLSAGIIMISTGKDVPYHGFPVPHEAGWILVFGGSAIGILSFRAMRRGEGKPRHYTDEDCVHAKAELDRLYLREHGVLPEAPEQSGAGDLDESEEKRVPVKDYDIAIFTGIILVGLIACGVGIWMWLAGIGELFYWRYTGLGVFRTLLIFGGAAMAIISGRILWEERRMKIQRQKERKEQKISERKDTME